MHTFTCKLLFDFSEDDHEFLQEVTITGQQGDEEMVSRKKGGSDIQEGFLNPTACLHLGDALLFTVNTRHYPQYDT